MPNQRRVLVIGLDGATFTILQPLMEQGRLPHLAEMQRAGSWGPLLSTMALTMELAPNRHGWWNS